jgi:hypothetical protein
MAFGIYAYWCFSLTHAASLGGHISRINGQVERASKINGHPAVRPLLIHIVWQRRHSGLPALLGAGRSASFASQCCEHG